MKYTLITATVILLVILGAILFFILRPTMQDEPVSAPQPDPFEQNEYTQGTPQTPTREIPLSSTQGTIMVPSFVEGTPTLDLDAASYHYVTYNQDYTPVDPAYGIVYGTDGSLSIGIFAEPLGASRLKAEARLRQLLSLSDAQLCSLTVQVSVPASVNETLAGRNLGLSFCPGAAPLPN